MSRYKVSSGFELYRDGIMISSCDSMVICADFDAATRVFLSKIEELNDKAASAYDYDELDAEAYIEVMSGNYSISKINSFRLDLKSKNMMKEGLDES